MSSVGKTFANRVGSTYTRGTASRAAKGLAGRYGMTPKGFRKGNASYSAALGRGASAGKVGKSSSKYSGKKMPKGM